MTRFCNNQYNLGDLIDQEWQEVKDIFRHKQGAPNDNFRKIICSEDDLDLEFSHHFL